MPAPCMAGIPGSLEVSAIPENMSRKLVGPKAIDPDCVCVVFFLKAVDYVAIQVNTYRG